VNRSTGLLLTDLDPTVYSHLDLTWHLPAAGVWESFQNAKVMNKNLKFVPFLKFAKIREFSKNFRLKCVLSK